MQNKKDKKKSTCAGIRTRDLRSTTALWKKQITQPTWDYNWWEDDWWKDDWWNDDMRDLDWCDYERRD